MARGLDLARERPHRRPSLTPMVDVVFLLLVFFMLAARFGVDRVIPLAPPAETRGGTYEGAPRLVSVTPDAILLNGRPVAAEALAGALGPLMPGPGAAVVVRARDGAALHRLVGVLDGLRAAGFTNLVLAE